MGGPRTQGVVYIQQYTGEPLAKEILLDMNGSQAGEIPVGLQKTHQENAA